MMKLSTMKKVVDTVDREWRSPLAESILTRWGYDEGSVYYYRSSANFIFVFKKDGVTHFLRFNDSCERDLHAIESEMEILLYLQKKHENIVKPIKSLDQKYIEVITTKKATYYAVVFEALPGKQVEIEELEQIQFYKWGKSLGSLHQILKRLPNEYKDKRPHCEELLRQIEEQLPEEEIAAKEELKRVKDWSKNLQQFDDQFGIIHFDFELDNLRWNNGTIGILDFDECMQNWFAADIAYALRDLFKDNIDLHHPFFQEFIKGYRNETELDTIFFNELSWFMRMHNIIMFTKLQRSLDIVVLGDDPQWLKELNDKLLRKVDSYRSFFEKK